MGTAWLAGSAPATAMLWKQSQNVPRLQESFSSGEVRFVLLQRRGGSGKLHLQRGRDAVPEQDARAENLLFAALLEQLGYQAGPAGLVAGAEAGAVVAVEVFVEQDVIAPMRVGLELVGAAEHGTAAVLVAKKEPGQAAG